MHGLVSKPATDNGTAHATARDGHQALFPPRLAPAPARGVGWIACMTWSFDGAHATQQRT